MIHVPDGAPQHMVALKKANQVRLARSELKRQVTEGEITAAAVLRDPPPEAMTMPVIDLLVCQHRWGATRARRVLGMVPVLEQKPIGRMTLRQQFYLASLIEMDQERLREERATLHLKQWAFERNQRRAA